MDDTATSKNLTMALLAGSVTLSGMLIALPFLPTGDHISSGWGALAGRLHILIIHFPIVIILILLIAWLAIHFFKKTGFSAVLPWLWGLTITACLASVGAGYLLFRSGEYEGELVQNHFWGGVVTAISSLWGGFAYFKTIKGIGAHWGKIHFLLLSIAAISVIYTGHMGGSLTHGRDFLTEMIPIRTRSASTGGIKVKNTESLLVFQDMLIPVFKEHCTNCHNAHRKKGGLVLNSFAELNVGGDSGKPMLVSGSPDSSELYRRVNLPDGHDDRMPPEGKRGLAAEELAILKWWLESGADPEDTLGNGPDDPLLRPVILSYLPQLNRQREMMLAEAEKRKALIPELEELGSKLGLIIRPDPETDSMSFNVSMQIPPRQVTDETLRALVDYGPVFSGISLVASEITDEGLFYLGKMPGLRKLFIQKTCITGEGLPFLKDLSQLEVMNLSQTNLVNDWVLQLSSFPALQEVYVFNTLADANVIEALDKYLVSTKVSLEEGPYY
jgi:hypothetical protein